MVAHGGGEPSEMLMPAADLKVLLRVARLRPISCVVAMTRDGHAVITVDRRKKPRRLFANVRNEAAALGLVTGTLRYGRVRVAGGSESETAHVTVNRAPPGHMRPVLLPLLRRVGVPHVEFAVDEALEHEPEEGDEGRPEDEAAH